MKVQLAVLDGKDVMTERQRALWEKDALTNFKFSS
jgi:hypothetical protein